MALHSPKVFALTSGAKDARVIGELLMELEEKEEVKFEITAGFNLYSDEKVFTVDARKCAAINEDGLCVLLIKNKAPKARRLVPGLSDESFLRNSTPMSKEEIRALSICKLGVTKNACVYDIGSGSGSVAVELGLIDPSINVYAIEFKEAACSLIKENIAKFSVENVHLIEGVAPDAMEGLPSPTHVFIGGSGGQLETILAELRKFGSGIRIVVNAVTLETIAEINTVLKSYAIEDADMVQVAVSKAKTVGSYSVMQAHNPVYIVSFTL
jgi:precorrin-6Y C5,15-methyltransferase (decarboxylating)